MAKARVAAGLLAGCLLAWGASPALAQPSVAQMLQFKPRQQGVAPTTPTQDEQASCKVELEQGKRQGSSGWVLKDGKGQLLRRYFDSNGDKKIDQWSYYKDGAEIYREIDTNGNEKPDQYRWLNSGGTKWGVDANEDGRIESWRMISADEAAHEAYLAVATRDFARLQAVLVTDAELRALKLPSADADRIRKQLSEAEAKFQRTVQKLTTLDDKARFVRVEGAVPQCLPGDEQDTILHPERTVMYVTGENKHEFLNTGGMVQVGAAWRLTEAPGAADDATRPATQGAQPVADAALKGLYEKLEALEKRNVAIPVPGDHPEVARHYQERVGIVEQVLAKLTDAREREMWQKQLADNLSTWAQHSKEGDTAAIGRLAQMRADLERTAPGSDLAAAVTFRELWGRYARPLSQPRSPAELEKVQKGWNEALAKFVQQYPKAEDTADALQHLAMNAEYSGKEDEAKRWYQQIVQNFPKHALTPKAAGAARRLDMVGRPMELAGPTLQGQPFDVKNLRNKVVVVYYWAAGTTAQVCVGEFARLKMLQQTYGAKGLEVVTVSLEDRAEDANRFLQSNPLPGTHLFQAAEHQSGLNSPLAVHYGISTLPTIILVGKDGNVISRTLQINDLEDAIKKAL